MLGHSLVRCAREDQNRRSFAALGNGIHDAARVLALDLVSPFQARNVRQGHHGAGCCAGLARRQQVLRKVYLQ